MSAYTAAYSDIRINDDTRFRTQMGWIATQLETAGWAKQGDSGQIDWATVTAPAAADTSQGYEIRKSGNLYVKIEFGSGTAAYAKSLWLTFGDSTDGAGTILNPSSARIQVRTPTGTAGGSARAGDDFVSAAAGRMMVAMTDDTNAGYNGSFVLQKVHDPDLNENADETYWLLVLSYTNNIEAGLYYLGARGLQRTGVAENFGYTYLPRSVGDASNNPVVPIFAVHPLYGLVAMRDVMSGTHSLITYQSTVTINGRTYLAATGNSTSSYVWTIVHPFARNLLLRYD